MRVMRLEGGRNVRPNLFASVGGVLTLGLAAGAAAQTTTTISGGPGVSVPATISPGTPYPSPLVVSGLGEIMTDVNIRITGMQHTWASDLDIIIVGPAGQKAWLISDVGGQVGFDTAKTITLDDEAPTGIPGPCGNTMTPVIVDGASYRPTDCAPEPFGGTDIFPAPAPGAPYSLTLSVFDGTNPNGTWNLYMRDDSTADSGAFASWEITVTHIHNQCLDPLPLTCVGPDCYSCPANVNRNGPSATVVDVDDLITVILTWGQTGPGTTGLRPQGDCAPPPNGDCTVNVDDLIAVVLTWGSCLPPTGACCLGGVCSTQFQADCLAAGGIYQGNNTTCAGINCPISNDECTGAITIQAGIFPSGPIANHYTNAGATNGSVPTPACISFNGTMTRDVWFRHTVPSTPPSLAGHILRLQLCNTPNPFTDTVMAVYDGTCASLNLFACNDSACGPNGLRSNVETPVIPAGQTVYIRVGSWGSGAANQGPLVLDAQVVELTDDVCSGGHVLSIPGSASGQLLGATQDFGPTCNGVDAGRFRWYQVIGNGTTLTATTCNSISDNYNGILAVYCAGTFGCNGLNCVAASNANQGAPQQPPCIAFQGETVSWCSVNNQRYYIGVGVVASGLPGKPGEIDGEYTLTLTGGAGCTPGQGGVPVIDCLAGSPPLNDDCNLAFTALVGNTTFNNAIATPQDVGPGTVCGQPWSKDVWFRYTSANGGPVTISITSNPVFDSMCEVYTGTCAALGTPVACEDDDASCVACHPNFQFTAIAGQQYLLRITSWSNSGGAIGTLNIVDP